MPSGPSLNSVNDYSDVNTLSFQETVLMQQCADSTQTECIRQKLMNVIDAAYHVFKEEEEYANFTKEEIEDLQSSFEEAKQRYLPILKSELKNLSHIQAIVTKTLEPDMQLIQEVFSTIKKAYHHKDTYGISNIDRH